jgi:hypothetical protein
MNNNYTLDPLAAGLIREFLFRHGLKHALKAFDKEAAVSCNARSGTLPPTGR